jgi:hypothetical protein
MVIAAALRLWALDMGLPHPMTRPDEEVILAQTALVAEGRPDPSYTVYPSAYIHLTWAWGALGLRAAAAARVFPRADYVTVLREHPERLLLIDRALSALAGTLTVAILMLLVRPTLGSSAGLAAGFLIATNFLHVRDSHAVKPDALLTLGVVVALAAMLPLARRATLARGAVAGAAIGLAVAMKYPALLLLGPAYLAAVLGSDGSGWRRLAPGAALMAGLAAAAVFLATAPQLVFDPAARASLLGVLGNVFPQAFPAPAKPVFPPDLVGVPPPPEWWQGYVYHAVFSLRYGMGLLPTLLAPIAVAWGFASRRTLPVLAASWVVIYYAVNGLSPMILARYMTPLTPALALLEAGLVAALVQRVHFRHRWLVLGTVVMLLAAESTWSSVAHDVIAARTDTRVLASRWIAANIPAGARVAVIGTQLWSWGEPVMPSGISWLRAKPDADALEAERIEYVVTHDHVLFSSHVDPAALAVLAPRLELMAEFDPASGHGSAAVFEPLDAYYIPIHNFCAVSRPGPRVRIYRFRASPPAAQ